MNQPFDKAEVRRGVPRSLECAVAALFLILFSPLLLLVAILVAIGSPGPIVFRQQRMGRGGKPFTLIKFRTMTIGPSDGEPNVTAGDDPRITTVGKLLRKTKLDELPELFNILIGDMSWVGPRPEVPTFVDLKNFKWQQTLRVRPGLTDPVTLRLRNEEELLSSIDGDRDAFYRSHIVPFKLRGYLDYQNKRSFRSDLKILLATAAAILFPSSAKPPTIEELTSTERASS